MGAFHIPAQLSNDEQTVVVYGKKRAYGNGRVVWCLNGFYSYSRRSIPYRFISLPKTRRSLPAARAARVTLP